VIVARAHQIRELDARFIANGRDGQSWRGFSLASISPDCVGENLQPEWNPGQNAEIFGEPIDEAQL
jgi:hypothetical protein